MTNIYNKTCVEHESKRTSTVNIYIPIAIACNETLENCGKYFPMKAIGHVTEKLTMIFPTFYGFVIPVA